jgi:site-specific DNA recombinase
MVLNIMASIAEFERRQTAERISQSFLARAKRGLYNGGSVPLGYAVDPDKRGSLVVVPGEAELVRLIFSTFLKKETMAKTAKWLNDQKIEPPRRVRCGGGHRAKFFRFEMIHTVLRNPTYAGIRAFRIKQGAGFVTEHTKANWESIVDQDTFHRAQELLTKNRYRERSHLDLRYPFILSGVCFCQTCGHRMSGKSAHGKAGKIPYYEHTWERNRQAAVTDAPIRCHPARILAKKIEPLVWSDVKLFLTSESFISEVMESAQKTDPKEEQDQELKRIESKCATLARQIEVLAERISTLPARIDPSALYAQMENLQKSQKEAEALREQMRAQCTASEEQKIGMDSLQKFTEGFRALLSQADSNPELQGAIIRKLVHRVEVMKDGYEIIFHIGKGYFEKVARDQRLTEPTLKSQEDAQNEKGGLVLARPPSKPLERFFLDRCSKRLEKPSSQGTHDARVAPALTERSVPISSTTLFQFR